MNILHSTDEFIGVKGVPIFTQRWLPTSQARGDVVILHGISEHSGRYAYVAETLTQAGYGVHALDHRGHGRSGGARGYVDRFEEYVLDVKTFISSLHISASDRPIVLYGHSMGSLIALLYTFDHGDKLDGLMTTGTALKPTGQNSFTQNLAGLAASIVPKLKAIPPLDPAALSRDTVVLRDFEEDDLVYHGWLSIRQVSELFKAASTCVKRLPSLRIPFLALHGGADTVAKPIAATLISERTYPTKTSVIVYPGLFHEVQNEPEKEQVFADMIAWLETLNVSRAQAQ